MSISQIDGHPHHPNAHPNVDSDIHPDDLAAALAFPRLDDDLHPAREPKPAPQLSLAALDRLGLASAIAAPDQNAPLAVLTPASIFAPVAPAPHPSPTIVPRLRSPLAVSPPLPMLPRDLPIIITIDGPAGTGKSTVARLLARRLGLDFLDTGAMYRAAAAIALDLRLPAPLHAPANHAAIVAAVQTADLHFDWTQDPPRILASGPTPPHPAEFGGAVDLVDRIRQRDVTAVVSPIASISSLRQHLVAKQRVIGRQHPRLVTEGRDQGSIVFPDATVKFYLDASPDVRARRRADQLIASGQSADLGKLTAEILERDRSDSTRPDGPLICPPGALEVDTSDMTLDQVVDSLHQLVLNRV